VLEESREREEGVEGGAQGGRCTGRQSSTGRVAPSSSVRAGGAWRGDRYGAACVDSAGVRLAAPSSMRKKRMVGKKKEDDM